MSISISHFNYSFLVDIALIIGETSTGPNISLNSTKLSATAS